jgi:uncharacterized protein YggU (UPF0235/DUF167 family)
LSGQPWSADADGMTLHVRLTPRGGRDALDGVVTLSDGRAVLKARVRAVPEDGAANAALLGLLAHELGTARSAAALTAGHTARLKTIRISGDGPALAARLAHRLEPGTRP